MTVSVFPMSIRIILNRASKARMTVRNIMISKCKVFSRTSVKLRIIFFMVVITGILSLIHLKSDVIISTFSSKTRDHKTHGFHQENVNGRDQAQQLAQSRVTSATTSFMTGKDLKQYSLRLKDGTKEFRDCLNSPNSFPVLRKEQGSKCLFKPRMKDIEKLLFIDILKTFAKVTRDNDLTYFMYGGTLLGSWRHHGFIPWDDDLDVMMDASQKEQIYKILSSLHPTYNIWRPTGKYFPINFPWKFYSQFSREREPNKWNWPFIDIFFFSKNETHIWDDMYGRDRFSQNKANVFPLSVRPFESLWLPSPRKALETLDIWYDIKVCKSNRWDHKNKKPMLYESAIDCKKLHPFFPFVTRTSNCIETLKIGDHSYYSLQTECTL